MVAGALVLVAVGFSASGCADRDRSAPAAGPSSVAVFDPLVRPTSIGWLPEDMVHNLTRVSTDRYELTYLDGGSREPGALSATEIHLQIWPQDLAYWQRPGAESYDFKDTAPVNGRPAQWRSYVDANAGALRWEYRRRSWAQLDVTGSTGDSLELARRIAESANFEATERVRLPWRLTGLPSGLSVRSLQIIEDNSYQPWRAEIAFEGTAVDSSGQPPVLIVRANKGRVSPDPNYRPTPNTTVHGYPAMLEHFTDGTGDLLYVYRPDDIVHEVYASSSALALLGQSGLEGLVAGFELLGELPTWTDRPLG